MDKTDNVKTKRSQRDYNLGFKLAVVEQVEKGELSYKQAQKQYGIQGRSTVLVWLRKHDRLDWSNPYEATMPKSKQTPAQLIKQLERQLDDERTRHLILNKMVDVCDKEYGMGLRKKYSAEVSNSFNKRKK